VRLQQSLFAKPIRGANTLRRVVLQRAWYDDRATLGMLTIVGAKHDPFFTLENPDRLNKTDSLIPAGEYICSPHSGLKFKDVYILKDVPNRSGILFHWGNTEKDTSGCIILGSGSQMMWRDPAVTSSRDAFIKFSGIIGKQDFILLIKPLVLL